MLSQRSFRNYLPRFLALLIVLSLLLAACERPLQTGDETPQPEGVTTEDSEQGGGVPGEETAVEDLEEEPGAPAVEEEESEPAAAEPAEEEATTGEEEAVTEPEAGAAEEGMQEESAEAGAEEGAAEEEASPRPAEEDEAAATGEEEAAAEEEAAPEEATTDEEAAAEEEAAATEEETAAEEEATAEEAASEEEAVAEEEAAAEEEATATATRTEEITHVVQPGENLYRIGLKYGVSWVTLARYNNLANPNAIYVGQTLKIPPEGTADGGTPTPTPPPGETTTYVVQPGDTLYKIGQRYNISWVEIAQANNIVNPNQIYVGQQLTIPTGATPPPPSDVTHTVRQGETLFLISLHYGLPWTIVAEANSINPPYVIYPGQTLIIPGG